MARKAPDKAHREGITVIELMDMVRDETTATAWFEDVLWGGERYCGHCGSTRTKKSRTRSRCPTGARIVGLTSASRRHGYYPLQGSTS